MLKIKGSHGWNVYTVRMIEYGLIESGFLANPCADDRSVISNILASKSAERSFTGHDLDGPHPVV